MNQRYRSIVDVYVLMRRPDGQVLLLERANTGYADHQLCPPSGHLEEFESVVDGAIREANEEVGVIIDPSDLQFVHVVHHRAPGCEGRVGLFFLTEKWAGQPWNREPHMCAGLFWIDPTQPPSTTVAYTAAALQQITLGRPFSLDGWTPAHLDNVSYGAHRHAVTGHDSHDPR
ncbi:8-oxo-dGTP pyrophosphatase MutT (NUDIX family) [Kribbella aluminosa]|uniref:8-oxo-dGTP pyrophosphatase MutT (NUDIX family) n=1 Tax=Kribbella aluminosa TaxID=416017 RepID=A0ABS4UBC6_9ACTN|nr:NUDIX domain-containing protein [Kribbella aluminosa]MBP2348936.1 8-oxo-dGTP pyrophosphatase MutT (NUDIX family) [Kribbella aluminosa]